jgi:hypothetical protein
VIAAEKPRGSDFALSSSFADQDSLTGEPVY